MRGHSNVVGQQNIYHIIKLGCNDILILLRDIDAIQIVDRFLLQVYNTNFAVVESGQRNPQLEENIGIADSDLLN